MSSSATTLGMWKPFDAFRNGYAGPWNTPPLIAEKAWYDKSIPNRLGVSIKTLLEAKIRNLPVEELAKWGLGKKGPGALIPYCRFDDRKQLYVTGGYHPNQKVVPFGRLRLTNPTTDRKYDQCGGTGQQIYVPPMFPTGKFKVLVLVEGEFKALALMEAGIPALGLNGIWAWGKKRVLRNMKKVLPVILAAIEQGQPEVIYFLGDNDVALNYAFYQSVTEFAESLRQTVSTPVSLPRWPLTEPKGIDDVRATKGDTEFIDWWNDRAKTAVPVPDSIPELGITLLESSREYITNLPAGADRKKALKRLAESYWRGERKFTDWVLRFALDCGFGEEELKETAVEEKEKTVEEMAGQMGKAFTPSASIPAPPLRQGPPQPEVMSQKMADVVSRARAVLATVVVPPGIKGVKAARTTGRSLVACAAKDIDPYQTLLGKRFLCREGGLIVIGPSGIGKSSSSIQQDMMWCQGKPAFGINPAKPLRILGVQAENDDGDMTETTRGVIAGLELTQEELETVHLNTCYHTIRAMTGKEFLKELECLLAAYRPDLLRLDPLQAFLGADPTDTDAVARFLRSGLSLLLEKYQCGAIIAHHTPKTNYRDTRLWKPNDWMYAGAGCADMTNWARAIIVIDPTDTPGTFRFIAAKRDARMEWYDEQGRPVREKFFAHAKAPDAIFWEEVACEDIPAKSTAVAKRFPEEILPLLPENEAILKKELIHLANIKTGIGLGKVREFIDILIAGKKLVEVVRPRKGEVKPKRGNVYVGLPGCIDSEQAADNGHEQPPLTAAMA